MSRWLMFFLFYFGCFPLFSTHLAGGYLELIRVNGNNYNLKLHMFFDAHAGDPVNLEPQSVTVKSREKGTNLFIEQFTLYPYNPDVFYDVKNQNCSSQKFTFKEIVYERYQPVTLDSSLYYSSNGFYLYFQDCCWNDDLVNIVSPDQIGTTFLIEMPSLNKPNSSPYFNTIIASQYSATVNQPFSINASCVDPDGDDLVYSLSVPYNDAKTIQPFDNVILANGYSLSNPIKSVSPPTIDANTGVVSFTPADTGVYVISVICEEYRAGAKIGSSKRDIEIVVFKPVVTTNSQISISASFQNTAVTNNQLIKIDPNDINNCIGFSLNNANPTDEILTEVTSNGSPTQYYFYDGNTICFSSFCVDPSPNPLIMKYKVTRNNCGMVQNATFPVQFTWDKIVDNTVYPDPVIFAKFKNKLVNKNQTVVFEDNIGECLTLYATNIPAGKSLQLNNNYFTSVGLNDTISIPYCANRNCYVDTTLSPLNFVVKYTGNSCGTDLQSYITILTQNKLSAPKDTIPQFQLYYPNNVKIGDTVTFDSNSGQCLQIKIWNSGSINQIFSSIQSTDLGYYDLQLVTPWTQLDGDTFQTRLCLAPCLSNLKNIADVKFTLYKNNGGCPITYSPSQKFILKRPSNGIRDIIKFKFSYKNKYFKPGDTVNITNVLDSVKVTSFYNSLVYSQIFDLTVSGLIRGRDFNINSSAILSGDSGTTRISFTNCFPKGVFPFYLDAFYYKCGTRVDTIIQFYIKNGQASRFDTRILCNNKFYYANDTIRLKSIKDLMKIITYSGGVLYSVIFDIYAKTNNGDLIRYEDYSYENYGTMSGDSAYSILNLEKCLNGNSVVEFLANINQNNACGYNSDAFNLRFFASIDFPIGRSLTTDFLNSNKVYGIGETIDFKVTAIEFKNTTNKNPEIKYLDGAPIAISNSYFGTNTTVSEIQLKINCNVVLGSPYQLKFYLDKLNGECANQNELSLTIPINAKDSSFLPQPDLIPNVFSPNGDGKNDLYRLENMPENNCTFIFEAFTVLNRWGELVYLTKDKSFEWNANGVSDGIYNYNLDLRKQIFKGYLQILR